MRISIISDAYATLLILLGFAGIAAGIVLGVSALTILGALSFIVGMVIHFIWVGKR